MKCDFLLVWWYYRKRSCFPLVSGRKPTQGHSFFLIHDYFTESFYLEFMSDSCCWEEMLLLAICVLQWRVSGCTCNMLDIIESIHLVIKGLILNFHLGLDYLFKFTMTNDRCVGVKTNINVQTFTTAHTAPKVGLEINVWLNGDRCKAEAETLLSADWRNVEEALGSLPLRAGTLTPYGR